MDKEMQRIVDKLDFFCDAIVHHDEYKTQDLIHWLAVAADLIEELAGVKEQLAGMEIMLTSAQSAAETYKRKLDAAETYKRELDAAMADINMCCPCEVCTRSCTYDKVNPYDECADFEWRGLPEPPKEEV